MVNNALANPVVLAFVVSANNVLTGTQGGIFRSSGNGITWTEMATESIRFINQAFTISGNDIIAGTQVSGLLRGTDDE